jgi:hypothetical protein
MYNGRSAIEKRSILKRICNAIAKIQRTTGQIMVDD